MTTVAVVVVVVATIISPSVMGVLMGRKLDVIHDLVNSNLTRVQADLVVAQRRIAVLEDHLVQEGKMESRPQLEGE